jgi:hypothetical protein
MTTSTLLPLSASFGNRCGHDKTILRGASLPAHHKNRPSVLEAAKSRLVACFYQPQKYLPSLRFLNPSKKQKKSERREAMISVMLVLLHHTELDSLHVFKVFTYDRMRPLSLKEIARMAGLTLCRATRAMGDLTKAGYLYNQRRWKKVRDAVYYGEYSLRTLSIKFFKEIGLNLASLELARHWKRKKVALASARRKNLFQHLLKNRKTDIPQRSAVPAENVLYQQVLAHAETIKQSMSNGFSVKTLLNKALSRQL